MSIKLPNKFEFKVDGTNDYYIMAKHATDGEYYCYNTYENTSHSNLSLHRPQAIKNNIEEGAWVITKNLDEPEMVIPKEPEMVFPFTARGVLPPYHNMRFTLGSSDEVNVVVDGMKFYNAMTHTEVKEKIKAGTWIVTSVGEQKPPTSIDSLKIQVDSTGIKEATHNLNLLAQAVENVNISLESMQALLRKFGQGEMTASRADSFPTINFGV